MLPTSVATLRICGEPNRRVSAWISGNESWANASSCAQVTLAPTESTPSSQGDLRQLADAREAQDRRRLEPLLVALDAQLGGAGGDDRAGMAREKRRPLPAESGGRKPSPASRSG